jgi:hypothetical protein
MPFAPIEKTGPQGYISGVFSGDGGEYSDRLFKYEPISYTEGSFLTLFR